MVQTVSRRQIHNPWVWLCAKNLITAISLFSYASNDINTPIHFCRTKIKSKVQNMKYYFLYRKPKQCSHGKKNHTNQNIYMLLHFVHFFHMNKTWFYSLFQKYLLFTWCHVFNLNIQYQDITWWNAPSPSTFQKYHGLYTSMFFTWSICNMNKIPNFSYFNIMWLCECDFVSVSIRDVQI